LVKKEGRKPLPLQENKLEEESDLALMQSSGLFDKDFYLENNPDVEKAKVDPLFHYYYYGGMEGRDPSPGFDGHWYLDTYKDVKPTGLNPLIIPFAQATPSLF
jgi:O-antigen biosynthesis protein